MNKILHLSGFKHNWNQLQGKKILCKNILLDGFGNTPPYISGPKFPNVENIFINNCDKDFVYCWADHYTFPHANNLYLRSTPCETKVFGRQFQVIYALDKSYSEIDKCGEDNFEVISISEFDKLLDSYVKVDLEEVDISN